MVSKHGGVAVSLPEPPAKKPADDLFDMM